jgi:MoaA/NifB/PqqE/SkfB family radical SAM enzyme
MSTLQEPATTTLAEGPARVMPRCLYLEITDICNMKCPMCVTRNYRQPGGGRLLSRDEIKGLLLVPHAAGGGRHLVISGGEPLLSPILKDVLSDAVDLGYDITFATNILSEAVHSFHDIFEILNDRRHGFQFSFDSIEAGEMNVIRGKDVFSRVFNNARKIAALRKEHSYRTRVFAQIVLQEYNLDSIFKTIDFLTGAIEVDVCSVQPRVDYHDVTLDTYRDQIFNRYDDQVRSRFIEVGRQLVQLGQTDRRIEVEGRSFENWAGYYTDPLRLPGPCGSRNMIMVGARGDIRGCLFSPVTGNIRDIRLDSYLESEPYREFLELARVCRICLNGCS